jgi:heme ABC exporter ATP-binding subunit CcmA
LPDSGHLKRIQLEGVSKRYGRRHALKKVSLLFETGSVTGISGANGAGKTTLLGLMSTLVTASSGTLDFGGVGPLSADNVDEVRSHIGYLGHQSALYRSMTGEENLQFFGALAGHSGSELKASVASALDAVGMTKDRSRQVAECSRGMIQRFAFARLLVEDNDLWLLDEPTTGLDARSQEAVVGLIQEKAGAGGIVVVVSHDEAFLSHISSRVVTLESGRLQQNGEGRDA